MRSDNQKKSTPAPSYPERICHLTPKICILSCNFFDQSKIKELFRSVPTFRAYAKINLGLQILGNRPDGYHSISTVFHRIDLYDDITIEKSDSLQVTSSSPDAPSGEANLCYKAAQLVIEASGSNGGAAISITKRIPVGAGLGGGSSDAGVILRELPKLLGKKLNAEVVNTIALKVGSDVPFFLNAGTATGTGRGEILVYFPLSLPYYILLCYPNIHVSTAWAYQGVSNVQKSQSVDLQKILSEGRLQELENDFEPFVFRHYPDIQALKEMMLTNGAVASLMSGSGSSVFGLFESKSHADHIAEFCRKKNWLVSLTSPGFSPQ